MSNTEYRHGAWEKDLIHRGVITKDPNEKEIFKDLYYKTDRRCYEAVRAYLLNYPECSDIRRLLALTTVDDFLKYRTIGHTRANDIVNFFNPAPKIKLYKVVCQRCGRTFYSERDYINVRIESYEDNWPRGSYKLWCNNCRSKLKKLVYPDVHDMIFDFTESLSIRASNVLLRQHFNSFSEILDLSYDDLLKFEDCGEKTAKEIMDHIKEYRDGEIL